MLMSVLPDWQSLHGALLPAPAAGRVVALVATEAAAVAGWAPTVALELARRWSDEGARVMLVDGRLGNPSLHSAAGVPNREGLSDATLHGASMGRVAAQPEGEHFLLVTAGTPVADPGSVARDPRWYRTIGGMAEAGVTAALYLADGESSSAAFLGSASDIVVLAGPDEPMPMVIRDLEPLVRAVIGTEGEPGIPTGLEGDAASQSAASPKGGAGGIGKMIMFVVLAIVVAAVLGYLLTSGVG